MPDIFIGLLDIDDLPPSASNFFPAPASTLVSVTTLVSFDVIDLSSGVDTSTILVSVGPYPAIVNGVAAPGFAATISPITEGFHIEITPVNPLPYEQLVTVLYDISDSAGIPNRTVGSWSFSTETDTTAPVLSGFHPTPSSIDVANASSVTFTATDAQTGIRSDSLDITLNGVPAVVGGIPQPGFTGSVTPAPNGKTVTVTPVTPFGSFQTVNVAVRAKNGGLLELETTDSWSFRCADVVAPVPDVTNIVPAPNQTGVSLTDPIFIQFTDEHGIDPSTITVTVICRRRNAAPTP